MPMERAIPKRKDVEQRILDNNKEPAEKLRARIIAAMDKATSLPIRVPSESGGHVEFVLAEFRAQGWRFEEVEEQRDSIWKIR